MQCLSLVAAEGNGVDASWSVRLKTEGRIFWDQGLVDGLYTYHSPYFCLRSNYSHRFWKRTNMKIDRSNPPTDTQEQGQPRLRGTRMRLRTASTGSLNRTPATDKAAVSSTRCQIDTRAGQGAVSLDRWRSCHRNVKLVVWVPDRNRAFGSVQRRIPSS